MLFWFYYKILIYQDSKSGRCFPVMPVQAGTEQNQSDNTDIVSIYKAHVHICPLT